MAKKQAACSTDGIPADVLAIYERKETDASRLKYIDVQLDPRTPNTAASRHAQLLAQINNAFPGYIDAEEMAGQLSFFTKKDVDGTAKVRADISRKSIAEAEPVEEVREEPTKKARRPKRSPTKVAREKQPKSAAKAPSAATKLKRGTTRKSKEEQAAGPRIKEEGKPTGVAEPEQVEREEQQPTGVDQKTRYAGQELGMRDELDNALSDLTTTTGATWEGAVWTILDMALRSNSGLSGEQLRAYNEAVKMVNGEGRNAELLWGKDRTEDTTLVFLDMLNMEVRSKTTGEVSTPPFKKHIR